MKSTDRRYQEIFKDLITQGETMFPKYHNNQLTNELPLDPPCALKDEGWIKEIYIEECKEIAEKSFKSASDAMFVLLEQLYDSANSIDEQFIDAAAYYLCDYFEIDPEILDAGLSVVHFKSNKTAKRHDLFTWFSGYTRAQSELMRKEAIK